jgi:hypothetical protein
MRQDGQQQGMHQMTAIDATGGHEMGSATANKCAGRQAPAQQQHDLAAQNPVPQRATGASLAGRGMVQ